MLLNDCIKHYLNHIRHKRGLSNITCKHCTSWLHAYVRLLTENGYSAPLWKTRLPRPF